MRFIIKLLLILGLSLLLGLLITRPAVAKAPQQQNEDYVSEDIIIKEDAIQQTSQVFEEPPPNLERKTNRMGLRRDNPSVGYEGKSFTKEEVTQLIKDYSAQYGIDPSLPLRIASCESGYNQYAKNKGSTASGVFQYLSSTWRNTESGRQGVSVFDAEANIKMAVSSIAANGTAPWNASKPCWNHS